MTLIIKIKKIIIINKNKRKERGGGDLFIGQWWKHTTNNKTHVFFS